MKATKYVLSEIELMDSIEKIMKCNVASSTIEQTYDYV